VRLNSLFMCSTEWVHGRALARCRGASREVVEVDVCEGCWGQSAACASEGSDAEDVNQHLLAGVLLRHSTRAFMHHKLRRLGVTLTN
jgi:hypothetical protein